MRNLFIATLFALAVIVLFGIGGTIEMQSQKDQSRLITSVCRDV